MAIGDAAVQALAFEHLHPTEPGLEVRAVEPHLQPLADQARGHAVERALGTEHTELAHPRIELLEVSGAPLGQGLEARAFGFPGACEPLIEPSYGLGDELAVGLQVGELAAATQQQALIEGALQATLARFDGAILVALARVVAARAQPVVGAQLTIACGELLVLSKVVERRRQTVGAVFFGHAAGHPQCILQPASERLEALATEHHARMAPAAVRKGELVEPVGQRAPGHTHPERVGDREVRQPQPSGWVRLGEEDLALGTVLGTPLAHTALQGAQHRLVDTHRVAPLQLLEKRHRHEPRCALEHRHHLGVPDLRQRVGAGAPVARWPLRGQHQARFDAPCAAHADTRLGRGGLLGVLATQFLVLGHL